MNLKKTYVSLNIHSEDISFGISYLGFSNMCPRAHVKHNKKYIKVLMDPRKSTDKCTFVCPFSWVP